MQMLTAKISEQSYCSPVQCSAMNSTLRGLLCSVQCDMCDCNCYRDVTLNKHIKSKHFPSDWLSAVTDPVVSTIALGPGRSRSQILKRTFIKHSKENMTGWLLVPRLCIIVKKTRQHRYHLVSLSL